MTDLSHASVIFTLAVATAGPAMAQMSATEMSCRLSSLVAENRSADVGATIRPITPSWTESSRDAAIRQLEEVLRTPTFAGGTVYRIARLGEDLEEHLLVFRLIKGEVAGARVLYEWAPDGPVLTGMDFKSDISLLMQQPFLQEPEIVDCAS